MLVGLKDGKLLAERPASATNPAIEVRQALPNGIDINAIWSHLSRTGVTYGDDVRNRWGKRIDGWVGRRLAC